MMTSAKGREGLLGSLEKKKKFSFIGGGIAAVLSIPLMIFGPKADPNAPGASCPSEMTDTRILCSGQVTDDDIYTWNVTKAGKYELTVYAPAKKVPFDPGLIITDDKGTEIANVAGGVGNNAVAHVDVQPGKYKLKVWPADNYKVKGGYSYTFDITSVGGAAPAVAEPLNGEGGEPKAEDVAAAPPDEAPAPAADEPAPAPAPAAKKKKGKK
jgi:hypothetical protein